MTSLNPGHLCFPWQAGLRISNRAILAQGWGRFLARLVQKARASRVTVVEINPAYTSLQCSVCGYIARANRKSQAVFSCVACGHWSNADVNAAHNILARGLVLAPTPEHGASWLWPAARTSLSQDSSENLAKAVVAQVTTNLPRNPRPLGREGCQWSYAGTKR